MKWLFSICLCSTLAASGQKSSKHGKAKDSSLFTLCIAKGQAWEHWKKWWACAVSLGSSSNRTSDWRSRLYNEFWGRLRSTAKWLESYLLLWYFYFNVISKFILLTIPFKYYVNTIRRKSSSFFGSVSRRSKQLGLNSQQGAEENENFAHPHSFQNPCQWARYYCHPNRGRNDSLPQADGPQESKRFLN